MEEKQQYEIIEKLESALADAKKRISEGHKIHAAYLVISMDDRIIESAAGNRPTLIVLLAAAHQRELEELNRLMQQSCIASEK